MLKSLRTQQSLSVLATLAVCLFVTSQVLWAMGPARLLPSGKVAVYRGDQVISVLSEEAPLPEGALLVSEGQCGLRMDNLFLVAEDGSQFSVATGDAGRELLIRQGTLYFAMTGASGPMTFHTPDGSVTIARMTLNASAEGGLLKGYVDATPEGTRIGVLEGGSLVLLTAEGERTITAGRQITLAQADLFDDDLAAGAGAAGNGGEGLPGSHDYFENQTAGATVATVTVSDVDGIVGFTFSATGTNTSADGFYQIDNSGNITITEAGADSIVNDFESEPNSGSYDVDVVDSTGTTTTVAVTLNEIDMEEAALLAEDDGIPAAYFWGGGAALAAGIGIAAASGGGGGGGGGPVSPAAP
jgi:hypothetical protein